ncbi:MAG: hypothetical protein LZF60_130059 [Nitrospira sp.]|nr:MAG: hypothetical protein LZF60_130059 [Nitrospira sp.]
MPPTAAHTLMGPVRALTTVMILTRTYGIRNSETYRIHAIALTTARPVFLAPHLRALAAYA